MPPTTYHERVKKLLAIIAKDDQQSIPYVEFVERVKDSRILDLLTVGRGFATQVRKALRRECWARHVKLVVCPNGSVKVTFTATGLRYFQQFGVIKLYGRDAPAFQRLTVRQLHQETKALSRVLRDICSAIQGSQYQHGRLFSVEDIPTIMARVVERINTLGEQNTELTSMLAEERGAERAIRSVLARNNDSDI